MVRFSCFFISLCNPFELFDRFVVLILFFPRCFDHVAFLFFAATLFFCSSFLFCMLFSLGTAISRLFFFFHSCFAYRSFTMFSFLSDCSMLFALFFLLLFTSLILFFLFCFYTRTSVLLYMFYDIFPVYDPFELFFVFLLSSGCRVCYRFLFSCKLYRFFKNICFTRYPNQIRSFR